jgi:hypothetical protein
MQRQEDRARYRWIPVILLFVIGAVNILDRSTVAIGNPHIRADLNLSAGEMGLLLSAFSWRWMGLKQQFTRAWRRRGCVEHFMWPHAACCFDETSFASYWRKDRALFAVAMTTVALLAESVHTLSRWNKIKFSLTREKK